MSKDKRYVVQMEMYVYAENDYMARKRAHKLKGAFDKYDRKPGITGIGEQPFATTIAFSPAALTIVSMSECNAQPFVPFTQCAGKPIPSIVPLPGVILKEQWLGSSAVFE